MTKTSQAYHLVNILDHYSWSHLSGQPRTQGLDQDPGYQGPVVRSPFSLNGG